MAKICYLVTTFNEALQFQGKNLLHDFTPYSRREHAIEATAQLEGTKIPMVGKLELPDESSPMPTQTSMDSLTQLGYQPETAVSQGRDYRLAFRRKHMVRISVVPWVQMVEDISLKLALKEKMGRGAQEIMDYTKDRTFINGAWDDNGYDRLMATESDREESWDLSEKVSGIMAELDKTRMTIGFTKEELRFAYLSEVTIFEYTMALFGAEARRYARLYEGATIPELKAQYEEKMHFNFSRFELLKGQQAVRMMMLGQLDGDKGGLTPNGLLLKMFQKFGLMDGIAPEEREALERHLSTDPILVNLGRDDFDQVEMGERTFDEITDEQVRIDRRDL